jgi:hypothetical protein
MVIRGAKIAISLAIIVATALIGVTFIMTDEASAQFVSSSGVVIVRPGFGFDDRVVVTRPFFNPFLFENDFFFAEEEDEFFFERPFFFDREEFFFEREERDD